MKTLILIFCFLVFSKLLLFWLWLWQLKEYHWGRFMAHFETQKIRKFLFSFYGIRYPKLTLKALVILASGLLLEFLLLFYWPGLTSGVGPLILAPVIVSFLVFLFQIPATIFIKRILKKAGRKRERFKDLIVIGITGSYGKSSTKEFLATILSEKFRVLKTEKNINAEIGIARTILDKLKPEHQIFIAEIGAYQRGKIKEVCQMLQPKIGILTGINEQHLSTFGSPENIRKAKYELIESLPRTVTVRGLSKDGIPILYENCSRSVFLEELKIEKEYLLFKINKVDFRVNLLGGHNIKNILLAVCCVQKLGMSLEEISRACRRIKPEQGGIKFLKKNGPTILDASYSSNPDGVIADLEYLKIYSGQKVIVMPCLIELGPAGSGIHRRIGRKIAEICDLAIIATKDYFQEIKNGAEEKTETRVSVKLQRPGSLSLLLIEDPKEIIAKIKEFSGKDDVILLEGRVPKEVINLLKTK